MSALYAPFVFFESQLLTPALAAFFNLAALLVLVQRGTIASKRRMLAGGVLLGLSAGVRPDVLLPAGAVTLYLLWRVRNKSLLETAGRAAYLGAGILSVVLPITIRNWKITGELIPIASNAGINFYVGNATQADGISAVPVGLKWERMVSRVPQPTLEQPAVASRWWSARTWEEISSDPRKTLLRLGKKAAAFFNRREYRNNICYHFMQDRVRPLGLPFLQYGMILPLAMCGLVSLSRRRSRSERTAFFVTVLWVGCFWVLGIVFFVTARYRIPAVPVLMLPAGWALCQFASDVRAGRWRSTALHAIVILAAGALAWPMWFGQPQDGWARDYVNLGNAKQDLGDLRGAEQAYRQTLANWDDPDAHYRLALLLLYQGKSDQALLHLESARRILPDSPDLLLSSAEARLAAGDPQKARELLHQLLDLSKRSNLWPIRAKWAIAHIMLAGLEPAAAEGHWEQAWSIHPATAAEASFQRRENMTRVLETFRAEADSKPWDWYAQANYGLVLTETGQPAQALVPLRTAARLAPEKDGLQFQLARALMQSGNNREALTVLRKLHQRLPECPMRRDVRALIEQLENE
jgi:tetratricopeptide (TPR) repeat protein